MSTVDLSGGKSTITYSSAETPAQEAHRLLLEKRDHLLHIGVVVVVLGILIAITGAAIYTLFTSEREGMIAGAWSALTGVITGVAGYLVGKKSS